MSALGQWRWRTSPSVWLGVLLIPALVPGVDGHLSQRAHDILGFTWPADGALEFVRRVAPGAILATFAASVVLWLAGAAKLPLPWIPSSRQVSYFALTLLLGPGLIVETLLKPYWGRARPKDLIEFGGSSSFSPPWHWTDQCTGNCSFVSGHAAITFWLTAYAFVLPRKWRIPALAIALVLGYAMGGVRMLQGAHFFSDVVFAGAIVLGVNEFLAAVILRPAQQ